jgi:ribosomal protein S18 acetylase RimI-like enzyme
MQNIKSMRAWWRSTTAEEMLELEKHPSFDLEGRFIAEFNGTPVGAIHAHIEKSDKEKNGFIKDFCVLPVFRSRGIDESLLEAAINEFKKNGVSTVRAWTGVKRTDRIQFLERNGFKFAYRTIDMRISLADIPSNINENMEVAIRKLRTEKSSDIEALNWLGNECFKGNPIVAPKTVEETRQSLLNNSVFRQQEFFFGMLDKRNVGYIGLGIDEKYNAEHNVKSGFVNGIGVLPAFRKRGIGTRLMLHGLNALKARGMTSATLDTEDNNPTRAITLYEKIGFQVLQEYVTYKKNVAHG